MWTESLREGLRERVCLGDPERWSVPFKSDKGGIPHVKLTVEKMIEE